MKIIDDFKKSKTIKSADAKTLLGITTVVLANMTYFQDTLSPVVYGMILIGFGIVDRYLRQVTRKPLDEK